MLELDPSVKFTTFERADFEKVFGDGDLSKIGSDGKISDQISFDCIGAQVGECAGELKRCKACKHSKSDHNVVRVVFKQKKGHIFDESKAHETKVSGKTEKGLPVDAVIKHQLGRVLMGYKIG